MDHMEYSITLPPHVELTNAGAEWTAMKQRHFNHVNPNHQPSPANLFTSFLISISFDQVQDVLNTLGLSVEEALRFNKILKSFEDLCLPRFLIIYNRYRFFMCKQNGPEFNGFLQQLLAWSDLCEFGDLKDILLKDSIIRGISEESVRQHLLRTEQLDFNKTVEICKAGLVKHYATDSVKNVENEFADAWTDTCNDMVENNNSVFKLQMVDKAIGSSVEVFEKEAQTDLILNDDELLVNYEAMDVGQDRETNQKDSAHFSTISCIDSNSLCVQNIILSDGLNDMPVQEQRDCGVAIDTGPIVFVQKDLNEKSGADQNFDVGSEGGRDKIVCDTTGVRRSLRNKKKVVEDSCVVGIENELSNCDKNDEFNIVVNINERLKDDQQLESGKSNTLSSDIQSPHSEDNISLQQRAVPNKMFECKSCPSAFKTKANLKIHSNVHSENHTFVCDVCEYRYADSNKLKEHMRSHANKEPYKCPDCQKTFKWSGSLYRHKRSHSGVRPYKCRHANCDSTFADLTSLRRHSDSHTKIRPFKCSTCTSSFPDSWALGIHERIHSGERPHHCGVCDATFTRAHHLKDHEKLHTGEKPFKCEFCEAKFIEASKLKSHRRKHTGEKPYSCKVCEKTFTWSAAYKRHMKTHTLEKPYTCQVCGNSFADHTTLVRHRRTHTGEKPYRCDQCLATFADSSSLSRHRQIHSTDKDFTCSICSASFAVKAYLSRHLRIHSGEKPHQCNVCNAKFRDVSKLNRHKKIHIKGKCEDDVDQQNPKHKKQQPEQLKQDVLGENQREQLHVQNHLQQVHDEQQFEQQLQLQQRLQQHVHDEQQQQLQHIQLHHHQHLHQQQQQIAAVEAGTDKSSFLLWQEPQEIAAPSPMTTSAILGEVDVAGAVEDPLLLPPSTSSDFSSACHHQHAQDVHDMSQYLSSPLLEFDDDDHRHHIHLHHHDHHQLHQLHPPNLQEHHHQLDPPSLQEPHQIHHPSHCSLTRVPDQGFIHVVTGTVLEDILNN